MHFRKNILSLATYKPPLSNRINSGMHLMDFNERSSALSEAILVKLESWCREGLTHIYPDYSGLIEKISEYTNVSEKNIFLGNGSDQIIDCVMRAVLDQNEKVLIPKPSFAMFSQLANLTEAEIIYYDILHEDPFIEIQKKLDMGVRMVLMCQPNNPTGRYLDPKKITKMIKNYKKTWFFIDEAYFEFSGDTQLDYVSNYDNLVISRTFSKAFGLAALRLGYMVSSEKMIEQCSKIRGPYDINQFACYAAQVVLDQVDEIKSYAKNVMEINKPLIEEALLSKNIKFMPSKANFLNIVDELDLADHFSNNEVRVRKMSQPELKNSFRISIGDEAITAMTIKLIESYQKSNIA